MGDTVDFRRGPLDPIQHFILPGRSGIYIIGGPESVFNFFCSALACRTGTDPLVPVFTPLFTAGRGIISSVVSWGLSQSASMRHRKLKFHYSNPR